MGPHLAGRSAGLGRRSVLLLVSGSLIVGSAGCSGRRSAMRPIYGGSSVTTGSSVTSEPSRVIVDTPSRSAPTSEPIDDGFPPAGSQSAPVDRQVSPSRVDSPPASGEPTLKAPRSPLDRAPRSNIVPPEMNGPTAGAARDTSYTRRASVSKPRLAALRDKVRPFVNDPEDLFQPPKADRPWKFIVLHQSAKATGSYEEIDREHRKIQGWDGCGYHFVIGNGTGSPDGQVEVARRWSNQKHGLHCRNATDPDVNEYGIGICLIGDLDQGPPTARQVEAARALVAYLEQRYAVPAERVGSHADLAGTETTCPGKFFPEREIFGTKRESTAAR